MKPEPGPLIFKFDRVRLETPTGDLIIPELSWSVRPGEAWAICGPTAAGKTSILKALSGKLRIASGSLSWHADFGQQERSAVRAVFFKEESYQFSYAKHFYQQRWNFIQPEDDQTLDQFMRSHAECSEDQFHQIIGQFHLTELLPLSLIKLSNGQIRRARLARALLAQPKVLLLDQPFIGLDDISRSEIATWLNQLVVQGICLIIVTDDHNVPSCITHLLKVEEGDASVMPSTQFRARSLSKRFTHQSHAQNSSISNEQPHLKPARPTQPIVELRQVSIAYNGTKILDRISWSVLPGERWAIIGPNGSGKSTLLSLLYGDSGSNSVR